MQLPVVIHELAEFVRGAGRTDYEQLGEETREKVGSNPDLRRAAFNRGERPLPGLSAPPPRRTGWEDDGLL